MPAGDLISEIVMVEAADHLRTIFLPEVCNLLTGIRWPLDVGFSDFAASIQGAMGPAGVVFQHMLQGLKPMLAAWFEAVEKKKQEFVAVRLMSSMILITQR
jgi:hypothetical protein